MGRGWALCGSNFVHARPNDAIEGCQLAEAGVSAFEFWGQKRGLWVLKFDALAFFDGGGSFFLTAIKESIIKPFYQK